MSPYRETCSKIYHASRPGTVDGWDVASLIDAAGAQEVDLVKIDIEGGELEMFGEDADKSGSPGPAIFASPCKGRHRRLKTRRALS